MYKQMSRQVVNPNQERAILHTVGPAQVIAGPGSGKTFVTVHRILHLITEWGVDPARILVITFTKAAALEMQERFFRLTQPKRPPVRFGTFHAVFYHILKQSARYQGYSIMTESEKRKQIRQIVRMYSRFASVQEEDLEELTALVSNRKTGAKQKKTAIQNITEEDISFLVKEYESYQQEFGQMDFDDIMILCHRLLASEADTLARWQEQFQYILVDEFQDISPLQYEIVKMLAAPQHNLFIVGDDDQSIYGFRGASPDSMQQFGRDYPQASFILLDQNYRCHGRIVAAALRVIGENHNRIVKQIQAVHETGDGFCLRQYEQEEVKQRALLQEMHRIRQEGKLSGCAMICRTNYDCAMWAQILRKGGIPFSMKERPANRFRHFVVQDILAYLTLAEEAEGFQRRHFLRIMNRPVRYLKRDSVAGETVREKELLCWYDGSPVLQERIRRLFQDIGHLRGMRLCLQIHYIRNIIGYDGYLREKYGPEKAGELVRIGEEFQEFSGQFAALQEMWEYIAGYEDTLKDVQERNREEEDALHLLTMHASKGLEFDRVYLPDCQEGKIPSAKSVTEAEIEEERRMFYVAMTRAKERLHVCYVRERYGKKQEMSRFIEEYLGKSPSQPLGRQGRPNR